MIKTMRAFLLIGLGAFLSGPIGAATFNVKNFGAKGDGSAVDTSAVNSAITAANNAGGGIVEFPSGKYKCGSIHLKNNVTLQLDSGSTIVANSSGIDSPESNSNSQWQDFGHSHFHDALIWGDGLSNIGITGPGTIDGNGNLTTQTPSSGKGDKAISLRKCNGVTLKGFTVRHAGHFALITNGTNNITMDNVKLLNSTDRDAFNLINSQHVRITNSRIEGSDDSMCLKSDYALGQKIANRDIHVDHCTILSTENNAVQFGSETVGDFSDCTFTNLTITGAGKAGLGVTSNDGSIIDGVTFSDITMTKCVTPIWLKITNNHRAPNSPPPGRIRNISFINITSSSQPSGAITSTVEGCGTVSPAIPIENVVFKNVKQTVPGGGSSSNVNNVPPNDNHWQPRYLGTAPSYGFFLRHVKNISFIGCTTRFGNTDNRAVITCDKNGQNLKIDGLSAQVGSGSPYDLRFVNTTGYQVTNCTNTNGGALRTSTSGSSATAIVAPAFFSPGSGDYSSVQSVTISSATSGASIRYTTDGSTPSSSSGTLYSGPITVDSAASLRAIAFLSGQASSAVTTAIYSFPSGDSGGGDSATEFEAENVSVTTSGTGTTLQSDVNSSGGKWISLDATGTGSWMEFTTPSIPAGTYQLSMMWKGNTNRGQLVMQVDGTQVGGTLDQYSSSAIYPNTLFGTVTFASSGTHLIRLSVTGKNSSSSGFLLSADKFTFAP